jgi:hypothetical protein
VARRLARLVARAPQSAANRAGRRQRAIGGVHRNNSNWSAPDRDAGRAGISHFPRRGRREGRSNRSQRNSPAGALYLGARGAQRLDSIRLSQRAWRRHQAGLARFPPRTRAHRRRTLDQVLHILTPHFRWRNGAFAPFPIVLHHAGRSKRMRGLRRTRRATSARVGGTRERARRLERRGNECEGWRHAATAARRGKRRRVDRHGQRGGQTAPWRGLGPGVVCSDAVAVGAWILEIERSAISSSCSASWVQLARTKRAIESVKGR